MLRDVQNAFRSIGKEVRGALALDETQNKGQGSELIHRQVVSAIAAGFVWSADSIFVRSDLWSLQHVQRLMDCGGIIVGESGLPVCVSLSAIATMGQCRYEGSVSRRLRRIGEANESSCVIGSIAKEEDEPTTTADTHVDPTMGCCCCEGTICESLIQQEATA